MRGFIFNWIPTNRINSLTGDTNQLIEVTTISQSAFDYSHLQNISQEQAPKAIAKAYSDLIKTIGVISSLNDNPLKPSTIFLTYNADTHDIQVYTQCIFNDAQSRFTIDPQNSLGAIDNHGSSAHLSDLLRAQLYPDHAEPNNTWQPLHASQLQQALNNSNTYKSIQPLIWWSYIALAALCKTQQEYETLSTGNTFFTNFIAMIPVYVSLLAKAYSNKIMLPMIAVLISLVTSVQIHYPQPNLNIPHSPTADILAIFTMVYAWLDTSVTYTKKASKLIDTQKDIIAACSFITNPQAPRLAEKNTQAQLFIKHTPELITHIPGKMNPILTSCCVALIFCYLSITNYMPQPNTPQQGNEPASSIWPIIGIGLMALGLINSGCTTKHKLNELFNTATRQAKQFESTLTLRHA